MGGASAPHKMVDDKISLKEYFEKLLHERDLYYTEKIKYLETRIVSVDDKHTASVLAVKEVSSATSAASEKAISKAEDAQKELNIKNNEFRGQLKDQADVLMPRSEANARFVNVDEKLTAIKVDFDRQMELNRKDIQDLRESRSSGQGKTEGVGMSITAIVTAVGFIATILAIIGSVAVLMNRQ